MKWWIRGTHRRLRMIVEQRVGRGSKVGMGDKDEKGKGPHEGGRAQHNE